jgi:hypothetical protein
MTVSQIVLKFYKLNMPTTIGKYKLGKVLGEGWNSQ